jgi:hypothetical protein
MKFSRITSLINIEEYASICPSIKDKLDILRIRQGSPKNKVIN